MTSRCSQAASRARFGRRSRSSRLGASRCDSHGPGIASLKRVRLLVLEAEHADGWNRGWHLPARMPVASACGSDRHRARRACRSPPAGPAASSILTAAASRKSSPRHIPNVEATAEVTAASVDNLKFLRDHKADLAFTTGDTLADAVNGTDAFEGTKLPLRALAVLYVNYTHVVTLGVQSDQDAGRSQRQSGLDRLAGQRRRGDGIPYARSRRHQSRDRHPEAEPRRRAGGRCVERRQDRRVLLERRAADRGAFSILRTRPASRFDCCPTTMCFRRCSEPTERRSISSGTFRRPPIRASKATSRSSR